MEDRTTIRVEMGGERKGWNGSGRPGATGVEDENDAGNPAFAVF